jgi:aspartyl-tRNA(Asn)/glutamyl-tRNA(Gln) amidotransferase subunit A
MPETIETIAAALRAGRTSCQELVERALQRARESQPRLNAFITIDEEGARAQASALDAELRAGRDRGPLHGVPIAHKDLICTRGVRTTAGSPLYAGHVPEHDAVIAARLREAGAVCIGKTNLHEHAYGITSTNPHFGAVRNPWDTERIPGGSSGGTAAALAAGIVPLATGTDTGGSIRCPASYCGVAGLKPTFGLLPVKGIIPLGYSLDHVGPMARTVREVALGLEAMAGKGGYLPEPGAPVDGLRVGWPENFYFDRVDPHIRDSAPAVARALAERGAIVTVVRVPDIARLNVVARLTLLVEAAAVHEKTLWQGKLYGADVTSLLEQGRLIPATDYVHAQRARARLKREFAALFDRIDVLLAPATPNTAPLIGQTTVEIDGQEEDTRLAATRLLRGLNAMGLPVLALPAAAHANGLPMGLQLVGRPFSEAMLLRVGQAAELPFREPPAFEQ